MDSSFLEFGSEPSQSKQQLTLIHGGAGPADPEGHRFKTAMAAMNKHATTLKSWDFNCSEMMPFTAERWTQMSRATQIALQGVHLLEGDEQFNAGKGAALQEDGVARVSAGFMESREQKFSAVINAEKIMHPSELASFLQIKEFPILDAQGARNLARELGVPEQDLATAERIERWKQYRRENNSGKSGTVGCVSVTSSGHLAALTSTGGVGNETVGRVGDTPTIAGNYCSDRVAVSCTGRGEQIINIGVAHAIALRFHEGLSLKEAVKKTMDEARSKNYSLAAICVAYNQTQQALDWVAGATARSFLWSKV